MVNIANVISLQYDCLFNYFFFLIFFVFSTFKGVIKNILWTGNNSLLCLAEVRKSSILQSLLLSSVSSCAS